MGCKKKPATIRGMVAGIYGLLIEWGSNSLAPLPVLVRMLLGQRELSDKFLQLDRLSGKFFSRTGHFLSG